MTSLTLDNLRTTFHLPREQAAVALGVSVNDLKKALKVLKVERWPFRKLSSLQSLQQDLERQMQALEATGDSRGQCLEMRELHARIGEDMAKIRIDPNHPLDEALHKVRLQNYKARFLRQHGGGVPKPLRLNTGTAGQAKNAPLQPSAQAFGMANPPIAQLVAPNIPMGSGPAGMAQHPPGLNTSAALKRTAEVAAMQWANNGGVPTAAVGAVSDTDSQGLARASRSRVSPGLPPPAPYGDPQRALSNAGQQHGDAMTMVVLPTLPEHGVLGNGPNRLAYSAPLYDDAADGISLGDYDAPSASYPNVQPDAGPAVRTSSGTGMGVIGDGMAAIKLEPYETAQWAAQVNTNIPPWMMPLGIQPVQWQVAQVQQQPPPQPLPQPQVVQPQQQASRYLSGPSDWAGTSMGVPAMAEAGHQGAQQQVRPQSGYINSNPNSQQPPPLTQPQPQHMAPQQPAVVQLASSQPLGSHPGHGAQPVQPQHAWTSPHLTGEYINWQPQHATHAPNLPSVRPKATPLEEMLDEMSSPGQTQGQQQPASQQRLSASQYPAQPPPSGPGYGAHAQQQVAQQQQQQQGPEPAPYHYIVKGSSGSQPAPMQPPSSKQSSQQWAPQGAAPPNTALRSGAMPPFFLLNSDDDDEDLSKFLSSPNFRQQHQGHARKAGAVTAPGPLAASHMAYAATQGQQYIQAAPQQPMQVVGSQGMSSGYPMQPMQQQQQQQPMQVVGSQGMSSGYPMQPMQQQQQQQQPMQVVGSQGMSSGNPMQPMQQQPQPMQPQPDGRTSASLGTHVPGNPITQSGGVQDVSQQQQQQQQQRLAAQQAYQRMLMQMANPTQAPAQQHPTQQQQQHMPRMHAPIYPTTGDSMPEAASTNPAPGMGSGWAPLPQAQVLSVQQQMPQQQMPQQQMPQQQMPQQQMPQQQLPQQQMPQQQMPQQQMAQQQIQHNSLPPQVLPAPAQAHHPAQGPAHGARPQQQMQQPGAGLDLPVQYGMWG